MLVKKIIHFLLEPVRFLGSRDLSDKIVQFFDRHKWLVFVVAFVIALVAVFVKYIYPELI